MDIRNITIKVIGISLLYLTVQANASDRINVTASKSTRGSTFDFSESFINSFCGDVDGCKIRISMHDWDGKGRSASREILFYYNTKKKTWRTSADREGTNDNGVTEHIIQAWSCFFTDGSYSNWKNLGDNSSNFGLLSWRDHNADCTISILD